MDIETNSIQERAGYSEQNPEDWVQQTIEALAELVSISNVQAKDIDGISYSGQMHGLVLLAVLIHAFVPNSLSRQYPWLEHWI